MDKRDVLDARGLVWVPDGASSHAYAPPTLIPSTILTDRTPATVAPIPDEIGGYRVMVGEIEVWRCGELPAPSIEAMNIFMNAHTMAASVRDEVQKWREAMWAAQDEPA
jgi:hypothetical protein